MKQLRATVTGKVQGVFFRAHTQRQAEWLGLNGYALNLPDGGVEVIAEGEQPALETLLAWLQHGPPNAAVTSVQPQWRAASGEFQRFEVRP
jgi:acylphosphatase